MNTIAIDVRNLPEEFKKAESVADKLALLHRRKAWLNSRIPALQQKINGEGELIKRGWIIGELTTLQAEQASINELIKEHNIIYNNTVQRKIIEYLVSNHKDIFDACAKAIK